MKNNNKFLKLVMAIIVSTTFGSMALDTTEPFDKGFSNNEFYVCFGGVGLDSGDRFVGAEYVIGAGINDRLGTIFSLAVESNEYFNNASLGGALGLYINVLDKEIPKLDFMISFSSEGVLVLSSEINFDFKLVGFQLTIEEALENGGSLKLSPSTGLAPQVYFNIGEKLQILAAIDFTFSRDHSEIGSTVLGFNAVLNDVVELITELSFDIPQNGERFSSNVGIGFVATIP